MGAARKSGKTSSAEKNGAAYDANVIGRFRVTLHAPILDDADAAAELHQRQPSSRDARQLAAQNTKTFGE
jgi:hypothetical protein